MSLEERIERLERTNRRYRLMFTLLGVLAVCAVGISATQDEGVPDVIQAKAFAVVDDEGNILVLLEETKGAGGVSIFDKTGDLLATMAFAPVEGKRAGVLGTYRGGKPLVMISAVPGGSGVIGTSNFEGKLMVEITTTVNGEGAIRTLKANGKPLVELGANTGGNGRIRTFNDQGKELVVIGGMAESDAMALAVYNKTGEAVCTLRVDENGNGVIGVWDRNGKGRTLKPGPEED